MDVDISKEERKQFMTELTELRNKVIVLEKANRSLTEERCGLRTELYQILTRIPQDLVDRRCEKHHDCNCEGCDKDGN